MPAHAPTDRGRTTPPHPGDGHVFQVHDEVIAAAQREHELQAAKAEIARLSEAVQQMAVKLTLVEGKGGWASMAGSRAASTSTSTSTSIFAHRVLLRPALLS